MMIPEADGDSFGITFRKATVMELAEPFAISQPAISKHIRVLERAGLVTRGRDAQRRPCRLEARPLAEATAWLEGYRRYWEESFDRLDELLGALQADQHEPRPRRSRPSARRVVLRGEEESAP